MHPIEIAAFALGLANVALVVRRSIWNYPFALAMVALYGWVFWQARLYSDMLLQGFFFAVNVYGWAAWRRARRLEGRVTVRGLTIGGRAGWLAGTVIAAVVWGLAMARLTDAALPYWDGANAMASVAAQLLLAQRRIENWPIWIAVDLSSIALYLEKTLVLTAVLYGAFLAMSVWGWVDWARARRT